MSIHDDIAVDLITSHRHETRKISFDTFASPAPVTSRHHLHVLSDSDSLRTMRAILVKDGKGPVENLYLGETETPAPGPGKVLVKVRT